MYLRVCVCVRVCFREFTQAQPLQLPDLLHLQHTAMMHGPVTNNAASIYNTCMYHGRS